MYVAKIKGWHFKQKMAISDNHWRHDELFRRVWILLMWICKWECQRILQQRPLHYFCLAWQVFIVAPCVLKVTAISRRILVLQWRHKFGGNQSTFVLLHKACLEGYGNPTVMLSLWKVLSPFLSRYINKELFFLWEKNSSCIPNRYNSRLVYLNIYILFVEDS